MYIFFACSLQEEHTRPFLIGSRQLLPVRCSPRVLNAKENMAALVIGKRRHISAHCVFDFIRQGFTVLIAWGRQLFELNLFGLLLQGLTCTAIDELRRNRREVRQRTSLSFTSQKLYDRVIWNLMGCSVCWKTWMIIYSTYMLGGFHKEVKVWIVVIADQIKVITNIVTGYDICELVFHSAPPCVQIFGLHSAIVV